ncbi:GerAB/ArcD/ProY family transporter [Paenibacillus solani]|uniref:GerAB/ArcD/ProY family transporter n=1 Tax=Paenibacillus solani TaxID=1705565 RepID=UPI003D282721
MKTTRPVSTLQFTLMVSAFQISVAFLSLPRELARQAGTDGWIAIFFGWGMATLASVALVKLMKNSPNGSILELIQRYMGVWASKMAAFIFMAYYLLLAYDGFMIASLVMKLWLLPSTYIYVIVLLLLIPTYQIAQHGFQAIGRYCEIVTLISIWIPFVYLSTLRHARWLYLLPVLKEGWLPVLSTVKIIFFPMLGIGLVFFIYPHLVNKEKALKAMVISNTLTCLVYLGITLVCFVYFSPDEIGEFNDPVISIMKSIELQFIERVEVPFIAFYLFVFSCVWIPSMHLVSMNSAWLLGRGGERGSLVVWCFAVAVSFFIYKPSFIDAARVNNFLSLTGFVMEFALPVCLLLYMAIAKKVRGGRRS